MRQSKVPNKFGLCFTKVTNSRFLVIDFTSFNSPIGVLFTFPSGYLFAIDLSVLSSRGWRLPPNLRSTPKERDSLNLFTDNTSLTCRQGFHLLRLVFTDIFEARFIWWTVSIQFKLINQLFSYFGLFPLRSPLMWESLLVSFPPLNYMLKFSGFPYSNSDPKFDFTLT